MVDDLTYWQKRYLKIKADSLNESNAYELQARARLSDAQKDIETAISSWVDKYSAEGKIDPIAAKQQLRGAKLTGWQNTLDEWIRKSEAGGYDNELNLEYYRSQVSRLQTLEAQLKSVMAEHTTIEQKKFGQRLKETFSNAYYVTVYTHQQQVGQLSANFANFNDRELQQVISKPWRGSDFSSRIWDTYTKDLPEMLTKTLIRGIVTGQDPTSLVRMTRSQFRNVERYNLHRLINTEMAHITENATFEGYKQDGVEWYEYLATLESHTCDICGHLDEQKFKVADRRDGSNYPPIHPNCRCTTGAYHPELEEGIEIERWSRDPETGESVNVRDMSFDDWKEHVGLTRTFDATDVIRGRTLPKEAEPNSVIGLKQGKSGIIKQKRYYDESGKPKKDIDYSNHGNPKMHPHVPHVHDWLNGKRGKERKADDGEK